MPNFHPRLIFVLTFWLSLTSICSAATPTNELSGDVLLSDQGSRVTIENGILSVEVEKSSGNLMSVTYRGQAMLSSPAYLNLHAGDEDADFKDHENTYTRLHAAQFRIAEDPTSNHGQAAELVITQPATESTPFQLELHYVMRRGVSGLYTYLLISHEAGAPGGEISQIRWLLRLRDEVFDFIAIDDERRHPMPPSGTPVKPLGPKESQLVTSGPFKGQIMDKYHSFVDAGEHFVHGWLGTQKKIGCWMISASTEDINGGPTKQHNTAHFERILMKIFSCTHYGAAPVSVGGEAWQKLYGPCVLYFNSDRDTDGLWRDANNQAAAERAAWPYAWMRHPAYPLKEERGVVTGQIRITDPTQGQVAPAGAWVGLAAKSPHWQQQSNGYQFWTRTDEQGRFILNAVRPGTYSLYVFTAGVMDEYRRDNLVVEKGKSLDLSMIDFHPPQFGRVLWQIGTPDRTAKEFRHGDNYRQWGLWQDYPKDFPNDVSFVIGKSHERTDWNYAQVAVPAGRKWVGTEWRVLFDLDAHPESGEALLRIAIAAATNADLYVSMNGRQVGHLATGKDSAVVRAGIHGQYSQLNLKFDAGLLKKGRNVLTLDQRAGRSMQTNIMYDCLRLEVAEPAH